MPLDDPRYTPKHPPTPKGDVPTVLARWGAASQLRWFDRFRDALGLKPASYWARFYCTSKSHLGPCCVSCDEDRLDDLEDYCCCKATWDADL